MAPPSSSLPATGNRNEKHANIKCQNCRVKKVKCRRSSPDIACCVCQKDGKVCPPDTPSRKASHQRRRLATAPTTRTTPTPTARLSTLGPPQIPLQSPYSGAPTSLSSHTTQDPTITTIDQHQSHYPATERDRSLPDEDATRSTSVPPSADSTTSKERLAYLVRVAKYVLPSVTNPSSFGNGSKRAQDLQDDLSGVRNSIISEVDECLRDIFSSPRKGCMPDKVILLEVHKHIHELEAALGHQLSSYRKFILLDRLIAIYNSEGDKPSMVGYVEELLRSPLPSECFNKYAETLRSALNSMSPNLSATLAQLGGSQDYNILHTSADNPFPVDHWLVIAGLDRGFAESGQEQDFKSYDVLGRTLVHVAADHDRTEFLSQMHLRQSGTVDAQDAIGRRPLGIAARQGHEKSFRNLLKNGADIRNRERERGYNALMLAVEGGHPTIVESLLELGADPNDQGSPGTPWPLSVAAFQGYERICDMLLKKGAMPDNWDPVHGKVAFDIACDNGHVGIVKLFIKATSHFLDAGISLLDAGISRAYISPEISAASPSFFQPQVYMPHPDPSTTSFQQSGPCVPLEAPSWSPLPFPAIAMPNTSSNPQGSRSSFTSQNGPGPVDTCSTAFDTSDRSMPNSTLSAYPTTSSQGSNWPPHTPTGTEYGEGSPTARIPQADDEFCWGPAS